jgi:hypothetical protein
MTKLKHAMTLLFFSASTASFLIMAWFAIHATAPGVLVVGELLSTVPNLAGLLVLVALIVYIFKEI